MFKRVNLHPFALLLVFMLALSIPALACGNSTTPEKVGEAEQPVATDVNGNSDEADAGAADSEAQPTAVSDAGDSVAPAPTEAPAATSTPAKTTFAVGDIISFGDIAMVVLGWDSPAGDEFNSPEAGNRFVMVDVLFHNSGVEAESVSSLLQTELKDDTNQVYDIDLFAVGTSKAATPDGEIPPGDSLRGEIGFQVPEDAKGLVFVFDSEVFGGGRTFIELGDEPATLDAPAELAGNTAENAFSVGDVIEAGDLHMTVESVTFPAGDEFSQPDPGHRFVAVDVLFENTGQEPEQVSSILQMFLKDDLSRQYSTDFSATLAAGGSTPDGEIAPGESIRGQLAYQAPETVSALYLIFDADIFGSGQAAVALPLQ